MSHGFITFYYCTESKWDETALNEWRMPFMASYFEAAKDIAKELDEVDGEVKERRQFWLKHQDHEKPVLMETEVEIVTEYYARSARE